MKTAFLIVLLTLFGVSQARGDADVNCSGSVNITDAVILINYIFGDGPEPAPCYSRVDSTVTLYWTTPIDVDVKEYEVRWAFDLATLLAWDSATVATPGLGSKTYPAQKNGFSVWGVNDDSVYYFGVKTADSSGNWSEVSNVISAKRTGR